MRRSFVVLIFAVFAFASNALANQEYGISQLFGPSTYDECITGSMKGTTSDVAARAIIQSCRSRFPPPQTPQKNCNFEADLEQLRVQDLRQQNGRISVAIHNGSQEFAYRMIFLVRFANGVENQYEAPSSILPLTTGPVWITTHQNSQITYFKIISATKC